MMGVYKGRLRETGSPLIVIEERKGIFGAFTQMQPQRLMPSWVKIDKNIS